MTVYFKIIINQITDMAMVLLICCAVLFFGSFFVLESYQTHVSSPVITSDKTNYKQGENIIISGWVNYNEEPTSDVLLRIILTNPLGIQIFDKYLTSDSDGKFSIEIPMESNTKAGNYVVEIISQCREIHREICTNQSETISIAIGDESNQNEKIPDWVRNIFVLYAEEKITEQELLGAIEFLVRQNIIQIGDNST